MIAQPPALPRGPAGTVWRLFLFLGAVVSCTTLLRAAETPKENPAPRYEFRTEHDPNGIGKFYLGREIAHVSAGPEWLERPEREIEEQPRLVLEAIKLKPGDVVADIGAGTGYFSWRMAKEVGEKGLVYAVDIQPEMIEYINANMARHGVQNVKAVLCTVNDPKLPPASIDLAILVDVYHEFSEPYETMENICKALKPGGRVVFVEYRLEDPSVPIKLVHKMSVAQVRKEMAVMPLEWVETQSNLPRQHIIIFKKK